MDINSEGLSLDSEITNVQEEGVGQKNLKIKMSRRRWGQKLLKIKTCGHLKSALLTGPLLPPPHTWRGVEISKPGFEKSADFGQNRG